MSLGQSQLWTYFVHFYSIHVEGCVCNYLTRSSPRAVKEKPQHTSGSWHAVKFGTCLQDYIKLSTGGCCGQYFHNTNSHHCILRLYVSIVLESASKRPCGLFSMKSFHISLAGSYRLLFNTQRMRRDECQLCNFTNASLRSWLPSIMQRFM
jgi:hypothetical protein